MENRYTHKIRKVLGSAQTTQQQADQAKVVSAAVKQTMTEKHNNDKLRKSQQGNMIIFRVKESESDEADTRKLEHATSFISLCADALEARVIEVKAIMRLGKKQNGGKPRPMKMSLENE